MTKSKITKEMIELCRKPFPVKAYSQHPTKTFLTTLKAFYVTERLNEVFGMGRWTIKVEIIERTSDYVLVQGEFESLDYDLVTPKQFGGHTTTGKNTEIADGYKSALTDVQSKIASYFEIGAEMFKGNINVPGKGKNYHPAAETKRAPDSQPVRQHPAAEPAKPVLTDEMTTNMVLKMSGQESPDEVKWKKYIMTFSPGKNREALLKKLNEIINPKTKK